MYTLRPTTTYGIVFLIRNHKIYGIYNFADIMTIYC